ncbi:hypothetical protein BDK89_1202 [Ilumatobacter fluminis]|uniref:Hpr(Ser) kinase/phosphatase n=1 Tax=Ilumatobacter fluminis TaxID=467091 RepID=A0A4R7HWX0_9ACTN|nr:hypothetical protein [Ilumatobacter fluminis]TDT15627.1 hypothetical protein BDK89_1202 [Ilumatobacter fluminis]
MATAGRRLTSDPRRAIAELRASWTACTGPVTSFAFRLGGLTIRLHGAGTVLERLVPAFEHHPPVEDTTVAPDLTVLVWDLSITEHRPHLAGDVFHVDGDHDESRSGGEVRVRYDWPQQAIQVWDADEATGYWVIEDPDRLAWWEEAAPLRPMLAWFLTAQGWYFAHGAAVAVDDRAVLLVGPGGSGKSTTALRCQRAGLDYLGDDYCLVGTFGDDDGYVVASLYRTAKLRPVDGPGFEAELTRNEEGRKIVLTVDDRHGGAVIGRARLLGVASVEVGSGATTEFSAGHAGTVLQALAPTTFEQLPGVGARSLRAFATMLRSVPTGIIRLGHDTAGVVTAVRDRIEDWS